MSDCVGQLRDAVGPDFSARLSADLPLLSGLPDTDAWHPGLAALLPVDYVDVWRKAHSRSAQGGSLVSLRAVAAALGGIPRPIGALHALAAALGVGTAGPRGPFARATAGDAAAIKRALGARGSLI